MGFTRYWEFNTLDSEKFKDFSSICQTLIDNMDTPLDDIIVNETQVRFNGVDDDAHETFNFCINKEGFNFCKTNLKPYDVVVFGCLYVAKNIFGDSIKISGDCDPSDDEVEIEKVKSILRDFKLNQIIE
jgi:hypothetical protein